MKKIGEIQLSDTIVMLFFQGSREKFINSQPTASDSPQEQACNRGCNGGLTKGEGCCWPLIQALNLMLVSYGGGQLLGHDIVMSEVETQRTLENIRFQDMPWAVHGNCLPGDFAANWSTWGAELSTIYLLIEEVSIWLRDSSSGKHSLILNQ